MGKNISLGTTTKKRAKVLVSALIDLANKELPMALLEKYSQSNEEIIKSSWLGSTSVKLKVFATIENLGSFITDYEAQCPEKIFSRVSDKSIRSYENIIKDRLRDTIDALKKLRLLNEKTAKLNSKCREFDIYLNSIDKENIILWLFDNRESEWDKRKQTIKSKLASFSCGDEYKKPFIITAEIEKYLNAKSSKKKGIYLPRSNELIWGRNSFVESIVDYFHDPSNKHIISLSSPPGYGKTEVANCIGWEVLERKIFDEVLYVKARQSLLFESELNSEGSNNFLDWNLFSQKLSQQLQCCSSSIISRLRERKYLIILDNAETSNYKEIIESINFMLNPSYLLITSRIFSEDYRYIYSKELPGLDYDAYLPLIKSEARRQNILPVLDANEKILHEIYTLSDGAPLAIHFLLGRVKAGDPLDNVLSDLKRAHKNVNSFYQYAFDFAWKYIKEESREILLNLARFNSSFPAHEIKQICKFESSDFNCLVKELKLVYLIQIDSSTDRQRIDLHPWIRAAIRSKLHNIWNKPSLYEIQEIIKAKFG